VLQPQTGLLKGKFQAKLDIAILRARRRDGSEVRVPERSGRIVEVRMVQRVEQLGAELELQPLFDREVLEHGEIHIDQSRSVQQVAPFAAINIPAGWRQSVRRG